MACAGNYKHKQEMTQNYIIIQNTTHLQTRLINGLNQLVCHPLSVAMVNEEHLILLIPSVSNQPSIPPS